MNRARLDPLRAVAIVRVSTAEQALGPRAQVRAIEQWAARQGVTIVAVFMDLGVSGAAPVSDRPGLLGALASLPGLGAGVLVAAKRDRLARDLVTVRGVTKEAEKVGAVVRTADGASDGQGATARLQQGLFDLLAEHERELIRERTKAALAVKRARGERVGAVPYGFDVAEDGRTLVPNAAEQALRARVLAWKGNGAKVADIVRLLHAEGALSRVGRPFQRTQIVNMLAS